MSMHHYLNFRECYSKPLAQKLSLGVGNNPHIHIGEFCQVHIAMHYH